MKLAFYYSKCLTSSLLAVCMLGLSYYPVHAENYKDSP